MISCISWPALFSERTVFIRNKMIQLVESDISAAVFEVSIPSLGTGIEIAHAYLRPRMGLTPIPVIALYQNGFWPNNLSAMITDITKEKVPHCHVVKYDSFEEIQKLIKPLMPEPIASGKIGYTTNNFSIYGQITARKCQYCGHHEVGLKTDIGNYISLKPGMNVTIHSENQ